MRDGSLIFKFEPGKIVEVRQNPGLDQFYEGLFRSAYRSASRPSGGVDAGIRLVVFGAFWLEARSTLILRNALVLEMRERSFAPALWQALKRAALVEKMELLLALASAELREEYWELAIQLRKLLAFRNRLAHFKESDTAIASPLESIKEVERMFQVSEDPRLIRELKRPDVLKHAQTVLRLARWLGRVEKVHAKRRGVIVGPLKRV